MPPRPPLSTATLPSRSTAVGAPRDSAAAVRSVKSQALFDGAMELQIEHRGDRYRLRQTSLGKLILTK